MMKKGFFYYCLIVSLVAHSLFVFFLRIEDTENKKKNEPLVIDLLGQPRLGPVTKLPEGAKESKHTIVAPKEHGRDTVAKASPLRPSASFFPVPEQKSPPSPPPKGNPVLPRDTGGIQSEQGQPGSPAPKNQVPAPSSSEGSKGTPGRIVGPTPEDLMRYAKLDRKTETAKDEEAITLDTEDLMYTSYLQGLKSKIEVLWKYPESARRAGIQGNLVMRFSINKSGWVEDIEVVKSSGYSDLDQAARQALLDANPFNPLPDGWNKDYFTITGTFIYRLYGLYLR